ncbi:hypothetical protein I3843_11G073900 [Carya illinoinensis]|nr:hypothetical protein I3843_11G073900 [Carya illinoinensis]
MTVTDSALNSVNRKSHGISSGIAFLLHSCIFSSSAALQNWTWEKHFQSATLGATLDCYNNPSIDYLVSG